MTGCGRCGVGPEDECAMDCLSRQVKRCEGCSWQDCKGCSCRCHTGVLGLLGR